MSGRKLINGKSDLKVKEINDVTCKYCPKCETYKPMTSEYFHKNKNLSTGFDSYCKECKKNLKGIYTRYKELNEHNELYCLKCKTYKPLQEFDDTLGHNHKRLNKDIYCKKCRTIVDNPLISHINKIIYDCNYIKDKYKREYNVTITTEEIIQLYNKQDYKCALTNIDLTYSKDTPSTNLSIDRINPGMDYSVSNIRLVCSTVNIMRNSMSDSEFINWCNLVVKYKLNQ